MMTGADGEFVFGPYRLLDRARLLLRDGTPVPLPSRAFDLLKILLESRGTIVARDDLTRRVWPTGRVHENNLAVQMSALRRTLGPTRDGRPYIATVPGRGFQFVAPVALQPPIPLPRAPASTLVRDLVERGVHFLHQGGEQNLQRAIERFEQALGEDPDFAPAHRGLARGWINLVGESYRAPMPGIDNAAAALERSLALEPDHPEALILLGSLRHRYDFDWPAALPCFQHAASLAPDTAFVHSAFGFHLILAGEAEAAERELTTARRLDPHYLNSRWHMVYLRLVQRRWPALRAELTGLMDLMGEDFRVLGLAATIDLYTGDYRAALAGFEAVEAAAPQHPVGLVGIAQASLRLGDHAAADRAIATLRGRFTGGYVSPYQLALIEICRGDTAATLRLLEEAAILRDSNVIFAPLEPSFAPLQGEPHFTSLLTRHRRKGRWG